MIKTDQHPKYMYKFSFYKIDLYYLFFYIQFDNSGIFEIHHHHHQNSLALFLCFTGYLTRCKRYQLSHSTETRSLSNHKSWEFLKLTKSRT